MLPQSLDTHIDIEKIQISMIRRESFAKKISQLCSLSQSTRQLSRRAIKRANPTLNEQESELLFIKYIYGSDLAIRFRHNWLNNRPQIPMKKSEIIEACSPTDNLNIESQSGNRNYETIL